MYKQRHDRVTSIVHWNLLRCFNQPVSCNYWVQNPTAVVEDSAVNVLWDFNIYTNYHLLARRPDIFMLDKQQKMVQIIDIVVPLDSNVPMKEKESRRNIRTCLLIYLLYGA